MIKLRILGTTELRGRDGTLEHSFLTGPKRLALLTYLLLARPRGYKRRDVLLPLFWPEHGQKSARNALSNMLYHIRRVLGSDVLTNRGTEEIGVRREHVWCDAIAFEQALDRHEAEEALTLYRDDLLKGFHFSGGSAAFEHWLDGERNRLRMRAIAAAWELSGDAENAGDGSAAVGWARRAADLAPHSETDHRRLMALLDRSGNRAGALESYREFRERLEREWDIEPSPELRALAEEIGSRPRATPRRGRSLAVLPFANFSPEDKNEYLSDGITEELIHRLVKVRGLRVAARTSSFAFKDRHAGVREIGQKLQVSHVLEGSVRKAGDRLRVTAQLVAVDTEYHLWSETYERKLEDVLAIQDEISRMIVDALHVEFVDADAPDHLRATDDPKAYDLYVKGRYYFNKRTEPALRSAVECFEQALARDPEYARAYAGMADSYLVLGSSTLNALPPDAALERAKTAARKALALDDSLAEAQVSLGVIRMRQYDWEGAYEQFEKAIELDPTYAEAHQRRGWLLALLGEFDRALAALRRAEELDPLSLPIKTAIGRLFHFMRRPEDALAQYRRVLDIDPGYDGAHLGIGLTLLITERYAEAIACFQRRVEYAGDTAVHTLLLAFAHALDGDEQQARILVDQALERHGQTYIPLVGVAWVHMGLGEFDTALDLLEEARRQNVPAATMKVEPLLDPVRSDPRFQRLLRAVGLHAEERRLV